MHLFEDLFTLGRSGKLVTRVQQRSRVVNAANMTQGIRARRGDGTFGEAVPGANIVVVPDFHVGREPAATIEIGVEVKILHKAMIKQIDRVMNDLQNQAWQFRRGGNQAICVALIGINHAPYAVSYEGERAFRTDGQANRHPIQEAPEAERRLMHHVSGLYDEFIILRYAAINESPFPFSWVNVQQTSLDYAASLVRLSVLYDQRF